MRRVAAAVSVALFSGALVIMAPSPASACEMVRGGASETVTLRTLHLEIKPPKAVEIGSVAKFRVKVTRPAKEDPLGQGIPIEDRPYVEPAPDVIVGIGLTIGDVFLPGAALSDENGIAIVKIKLQNYAPRNTWVDMSVYAWKITYETPCLTVREDGYNQQAKVFKTS